MVKAITLLLSIFLFFSACKKLGTPEIDNESQSGQDAVIADQEFSAIATQLLRHLFVTNSAVDIEKKFGCATLNFVGGDTLNFLPAAVYTLSAAQLGGNASDGKERTGTIRIELSQPFDRAGAVTRIDLLNYVSDGVNFQAKSFTLTTIAESGKYFAVNLGVSDGKCSDEGSIFMFSAQRRLSVFFGGGPLGAEPYVTLYGSASGINREGRVFTAEIISDVLKYNACPFFSAGKMNLSPSGLKPRTLEFGDGNCDDLAHYTVSENKVAFKLK